MVSYSILFLMMISFCFADVNEKLQEIVVESSFQLTEGISLDYRTVAGTLVIKDKEGDDRASIFYTAYFKKDVKNLNQRPLMFCCNGGPGAGSVWLNLGCLGPRTLPFDDLSFAAPPYTLVDNPWTALEWTDLVFIDPVGSGFSKMPDDGDAKKFFGVAEDVDDLCKFIVKFVSKYKRWDCPKYLTGESYGGLRVVKIATQLHDDFALDFNGLILVSPILDFQTITFSSGNELPYMTFLPTFSAVSKYHFDQEQPDLKTVELWSLSQYAKALLLGCRLSAKVNEEVVEKLVAFTHLQKEFIEQQNLRIKPEKFRTELLKQKKLLLGRFDGRVTADALGNENIWIDPSLDAVHGALTATFSQFLLQSLKWPEAIPYRSLRIIPQWNYGKGNQFVEAVTDLDYLIHVNPSLKVFVACGVYDLAIPFSSIDYSLSHMTCSTKRVLSKRYFAGHMMYLNKKIRKELGDDIYNFLIEP